MNKKYSVPKNMKEKVEPIIIEIEKFCDENLNENFKEKAVELTSKLSRKRPSPLNSGRAKTWAAGILDTIMKINFIYDSSNPLYIMKKDFVKIIGVSQNTINKKSNEIMDLLNISIFSSEWFVEGNEGHTMSGILEMQNQLLELTRNMEMEFEDDDMDFMEEYDDKEEILNIIRSQDINTLDEKELEGFHEFCLQVACLIKEEIQEEFEEEDYYYERFEQIQLVLNKACDAALRLHEVNNKKIKPYYDVLYLMAEVYMDGNNFDEALRRYEHIDKHYPNYPSPIKCKIFNIKYVTNNGVDEYLKSFENENNAIWEYNRALYYYSKGSKEQAIKHLKEALRKNNKIAEILLDEEEINLSGNLSPLESEAVGYYISSSWIWTGTEDALEWLFYKKQELMK